MVGGVENVRRYVGRCAGVEVRRDMERGVG